jgi:hypothetical protein
MRKLIISGVLCLLATPALADPAADVTTALEESRSTLGIVLGFEPGKVGEVWIKQAREQGNACTTAVDKALAGGLAATQKLEIGTDSITLGEAKARYCDKLLAWAASYGGASAKAKAAASEKVTAKYTKHGIKGDRLKLMVEYDDVRWRGKGCEYIDDPAKLAKAPLLFQWLENADGTHTIRRYQFKGDKLAGTTNKTFKKEAEAQKGCS